MDQRRKQLGFCSKNGTRKYKIQNPDIECRLDKDTEVLLLKTAKARTDGFDAIVCWKVDTLNQHDPASFVWQTLPYLVGGTATLPVLSLKKILRTADCVPLSSI